MTIASLSAWAVSASIDRQRIGRIEAALEEGRRLNANGRFAEAIRVLEVGIRSTRSLANDGDLRRPRR